MGLAYSPSLEANIKEATHIAQSLSMEILFVHVHEGSPDQLTAIQSAVEKIDAPSLPHRFIWRKGPVAKELLKVAEEEKADLLLIGAVAREGLIRYYKGSLARQLIRQTDCSVLLLNKPGSGEKAYDHIVSHGVLHPKTKDSLAKSLAIAKAFQSRSWSVMAEIPQENALEAENQRLEQLLSFSGTEASLKIKVQALVGKGGYSLGHYVQSQKGDLLVLNSPDTKLGYRDRVFTKDLEYLLSELPSDLLILHSSDRTAS